MTEFWNYEDKPAEPGWYPVLICYDPDEGAFPSVAYWSIGRICKWDRKGIVAFGQRRESEADAHKLAHQHDPDWR